MFLYRSNDDPYIGFKYVALQSDIMMKVVYRLTLKCIE